MKRFLSPTLVALTSSGKKFDNCLGYEQFSNGWFSLLREDGVSCYNEKAELQNIGHLDYVYVFRNGYILKRKTNEQMFYLSDPSGNNLFQAERVEVLTDSIMAVKQNYYWTIYVLSDSFKVLISDIVAEEISIHMCPSEKELLFVLSLSMDGKTEQKYFENTFFRRHITPQFTSLNLPNGMFAVSSHKARIEISKEDCFMCVNCDLTLYSDVLQVVASQLSGIIAFSNGAYLTKSSNNWWTLYNSKHELLLKFRRLELVQNENDIIFVGDTENGKNAVIVLKEKHVLNVTYDNKCYCYCNGHWFETENSQIFLI